MAIEQFKTSRQENAENEKTFIDYMEELNLQPEDFERGKILDVGSGNAGFAKWAKDHGVSDQIYNIDPFQKHRFRERSKSAYAEAQAIPFENESFAMVLANYVNFASLAENLEEIKKETVDAFSEMVRVLKPGGEIRFQFYNMKDEQNKDNPRNFYIDSVDGLLGELEENGYKVEFLNKSKAEEIEGRRIVRTIPIVKITKPER